MILSLFTCQLTNRSGSDYTLRPFQITVSEYDFELSLFAVSIEHYGSFEDTHRALFRVSYAREFKWLWLHVLYRRFSISLWRKGSNELPF